MKVFYKITALFGFLILLSCENNIEKQRHLICNDDYKYWHRIKEDSGETIPYFLILTCYTTDNRIIYFKKYYDIDSLYRVSPGDVIPASLWQLDNDSVLSYAWESLTEKNQSKSLILKLTKDTFISSPIDSSFIPSDYKIVRILPPDSLKHLLIHPDSLPDEPDWETIKSMIYKHWQKET